MSEKPLTPGNTPLNIVQIENPRAKTPKMMFELDEQDSDLEMPSASCDNSGELDENGHKETNQRIVFESDVEEKEMLCELVNRSVKQALDIFNVGIDLIDFQEKYNTMLVDISKIEEKLKLDQAKLTCCNTLLDSIIAKNTDMNITDQ